MKIIKNVLSSDAVTYLRNSLSKITFEDGRVTSTVIDKKNQQAFDPFLTEMIEKMLKHCSKFQRITIPAKNTRPMFSLYREGDYYRPHFDAAILDGVRTDLAVTISLTNKSDYSGGELRNAENNDGLKVDAGDAIIYPADTIHEVLPVTSGERLSVIFWVQSRIKDPRQRAIITELDEASRRTKDNEIRLIYNNLLRMWAE